MDFGLRVWAAVWVGDRVQEALGLSDRPSVSFGGLVFAPQVITGHVDSATLQSDAFQIGGVSFSSARLAFRDVRFQPDKLLLHHSGRVRVRTGAGVFGMTARDLEEALAARGVDVSVRFSGQEVLLSGGELPGDVRARPTIENDALVISGSSGVAFRLPLPALGGGIDYGGVALAGDEALLSVRVSGANLEGLVR
jgi:LmeA-like phospholipid-binding